MQVRPVKPQVCVERQRGRSIKSRHWLHAGGALCGLIWKTSIFARRKIEGAVLCEGASKILSSKSYFEVAVEQQEEKSNICLFLWVNEYRLLLYKAGFFSSRREVVIGVNENVDSLLQKNLYTSEEAAIHYTRSTHALLISLGAF